jgi:hypothetical protein
MRRWERQAHHKNKPMRSGINAHECTGYETAHKQRANSAYQDFFREARPKALPPKAFRSFPRPRKSHAFNFFPMNWYVLMFLH